LLNGLIFRSARGEHEGCPRNKARSCALIKIVGDDDCKVSVGSARETFLLRPREIILVRPLIVAITHRIDDSEIFHAAATVDDIPLVVRKIVSNLCNL